MLEARRLSKSFGPERVLDAVDLRVEPGKTLSVLGQSGSGKTTLLKAMAGLEGLDAGEVWLDGRDVSREPPERRRMVYLFQEPLLFPHLSAIGNVAFGLRVAGVPRDEAEERAADLLRDLGLIEHARKRPNQLSGGQKQRVAFGRALVVAPRVLLLDEPFGALDGRIRSEMQELFRRVIHERGMTTVFVTHDLKEALIVGDAFAILEGGTFEAFADRASFLESPRAGARDELEFWRSVLETSRALT